MRLLSVLFFTLVVGCTIAPKEREISNNSLTLSAEWIEISPTPPLIVEKQHQSISLGVKDISKWDIDSTSNSFVSPTGEKIAIFVELISTDDTKFTLTSIGLGPGLNFTHPSKQTSGRSSAFPKEMKFKMIRIKANKPLEINDIKWISITNY